MDYRIKKNYPIIELPKGYEEEKRVKCTPCSTCNQLVLASETGSNSWENDVKGVYIKKGLATDIVNFTMEDCDGNVLTNLGQSVTFPHDNLAVGFIYEWQQILSTYGSKCYTIKANFNIAGVTGDYTIGKYDLKSYSIESARRTVRVFSEFNSYYLKDKIDFTDSNFKDSVRFGGYFGNRQPKTEINNLINKGRKVEKVTRENLNVYELRTYPLNICITRQLLDFHFLNEDKILISDHNSTNHDYLLFDKDVVLENSADVNYRDGSRLADITATFGDREKLSKSFYNKNK